MVAQSSATATHTIFRCLWGLNFPPPQLQMIYSGSRVLWTPWDRQKCPDYQGVLIFLVILYDKVQFGTSTKCLGYAGVRNRFDCNSQN